MTFMPDSCSLCRSHSPIKPFFLFALGAVGMIAAGCGGGNSSSGGPIPGQTTTVAIQLSSTANNRFTQFGMNIEKISLTNKAGITTTIFSTPTAVDFMRSNGNSVPLATGTVPQDVYTSAAVAVSGPEFSYVSESSQGQITFATDAYGYTPTPPVVNLASPITVMGSTMGMTLNLQAAQSGSYDGVPPNQISYTINPTFNLTSFSIRTEATTPLNGKCTGMLAQVAAVSADSVTLAIGGPRLMQMRSVTAAINSGTVFQGIASAADLSAGSLVNIDMALEPDASYTATRIEVRDSAATNVVNGQLVQIYPSYNNYVSTTATEQMGSIVSVQPVGAGYPYEFGSSTNFLTSGQFKNLSSLPFSATFSPEALAPGQMVSTGSTTISYMGGTWTQPTSVTLMPQTIDAVVTGETTNANYSVYTAQLAPYDLIVQLNNPVNGPSLVTVPNPDVVYIYVGSDASLLNSAALGTGGTYRFHGLLFNDAGTLRLVCNQVDDGVSQ